MKRIIALLLAFSILISSCHTTQQLASIRSGGLNGGKTEGGTKAEDYINGNETFTAYHKDGKFIVKPSNVVDFNLYESVKTQRGRGGYDEGRDVRYKEDKSREKHKKESRREKKERKKKAKAERSEGVV